MSTISKIEKLKENLKQKYEEGKILLDLIKEDKINFEQAKKLDNLYYEAKSKTERGRTYLMANVTDGEYENAVAFLESYKVDDNINKARSNSLNFKEKYLSWFYATSENIKFTYPIKYSEFTNSYYFKSEKLNTLSEKSYKLENYLKNDTIPYTNSSNFNEELKRVIKAFNLFNFQLLSLKAIIDNLDTLSFNYENETYTHFQEENIDSAQKLLDNDFLRAAGAICGVIIEKHLTNKLLNNCPNNFTSKELTLATLNDKCKKAKLYMEPERTRIQNLAAIRNLCDHKKQRDPTKQEVQDLITGTKWVLYNI